MLDQNFKATRANQIWCSDITYIRTGEGFGYLCVVKDLYDEKIVGWSFKRHLKTELALEAFRHAVFRRKPRRSIIFHSDRGVQGEFNRPSQHLSHGGGNGKDRKLDEINYQAITDEIAGGTCASPGNTTTVLASDCNGGHERERRGIGRRRSGCRL